jgi:hypothetical protein
MATKMDTVLHQYNEMGLRRYDERGETTAANLNSLAVFTGMMEAAVDFQFTPLFDGGWPPC